jgi:hypothetical protein
MQHRGDLLDRVIYASLPENLPRDRGSAEIAQQLQGIEAE